MTTLYRYPPAALLLAALATSACGNLPQSSAPGNLAAPLPVSLAAVCADALPANGELHATLTLHQSYNDQHLYLAINTRHEQHTSIDLLTLQGMPLYRLQCTADGPREQLFTSLTDMVSPTAIMAYLSLIYGPDKQRLLAPGWRIKYQDPSRLVIEKSASGNGASRRISVKAHGAAPWYSSASLRDDAADTHLSIHNTGEPGALSE